MQYREELDNKNIIMDDKEIMLSTNAIFSNLIDHYFAIQNKKFTQIQALNFLDNISASLQSNLIISKFAFNKILSFVDIESLELADLLKYRHFLKFKELSNTYSEKVMNIILK